MKKIFVKHLIVKTLLFCVASVSQAASSRGCSEAAQAHAHFMWEQELKVGEGPSKREDISIGAVSFLGTNTNKETGLKNYVYEVYGSYQIQEGSDASYGYDLKLVLDENCSLVLALPKLEVLDL